MNKQEFILKLAQASGRTEEECGRINDILENHFIFSRKNRTIIAEEISLSLSIDMKQAETIYDQAKEIIGGGAKESLKHPFRSKD